MVSVFCPPVGGCSLWNEQKSGKSEKTWGERYNGVQENANSPMDVAGIWKF